MDSYLSTGTISLFFLKRFVSLRNVFEMPLSSKSTNQYGTSLMMLVMTVFQWMIITVLMHRRHEEVSTIATRNEQLSTQNAINTIGIDKERILEKNQTTIKLDGVAVTIMYRAPKWFHLRYKVMIDNAIANLPDASTWKVQIFVNEVFQNDQNLVQWNPGLVHMFDGRHPRVIVSPLPTNLTGRKNKPKDVLFSSWFWDNVAADRVLLFSGNGAFCGNQPFNSWNKYSLLDLDYLGVPSFDFDGIGGDGTSHTLRSRTAMRRIVQYRNENKITEFKHQEDYETLKAMIEINQKNAHLADSGTYEPFKIASREQTIAFGGVNDLSNDTIEGVVRLPLVVAGTQGRLIYAERDTLLKHCPELKVIFPSLHEPACFGAHPNPEICKATICALQETVSPHGC
jgi:hypothetical protein